jgi:hypothetical protein
MAVGGGYTTQLIFFNASGIEPLSGTIGFFSQSGWCKARRGPTLRGCTILMVVFTVLVFGSESNLFFVTRFFFRWGKAL